MQSPLLVASIFLASCILTLYLVLRHPTIRLVVKGRVREIDSYFLGGVFGAAVMIGCGFLGVTDVIRGLQGQGGLEPGGILVLFLSMVFLSVILDATGFFEYCARLALQWAGESGKRLFFSMYVMVSVLTVFTSNDIVILTFTPFIYYFTKAARVNPKPYLIAEFFAANTWSMLLYIGNPTNIVMAAAFGLTFDGYFRWMVIPTIAAGGVSMLALLLVFRRLISQPIHVVKMGSPNEAITDPTGARAGLLFLAGAIIGLAIAPYFGVSLWPVSAVFAGGMLGFLILRCIFQHGQGHSRRLLEQTRRRMPWAVIPFVLSLFLLVEALNTQGLIESLGFLIRSIAGDSVVVYVAIYGLASTFTANLINNIPMTVAFASLVKTVPSSGVVAALFATVIGSNLGANVTPIGALAGIMWMRILREKEFRITFLEFVKYGLMVTPATLLSSLSVLAFEVMLI